MKLNKIAIVACSNPITDSTNFEALKDILKDIGIDFISSKFILNNTDILNRDNSKMADEILEFFKDSSIDGIFDISGGDLANSILPYLNFEEIKKYPKPFFGYSDLTVLLNALYTKSDITTYNYQLLNLVKDKSKTQIKNFKATFNEENSSLFDFKYEFIKGNSLEGVLVGGNIRCLLKLSGTPYMPDFKNKVLFLESFSGNPYKILTFLNQIRDMDILKNLKGILIGSFTEMDNNNYLPSVNQMILKITENHNIPIAVTKEIGHQPLSKCIKIGNYIKL